MKTVSSLLDESWHERYRKISALNIRSSIYDVTNRCNLRCKGCFFFSSNEHEAATEETDLAKWYDFVQKEKDRGVNLAILIGGEPTLFLDRVEAFYKSNPVVLRNQRPDQDPPGPFPRYDDRHFPVGNEEDEKILRGKDTFAVSSKNYEGDPYTYYLYTITPKQLGRIDRIIRKIDDVGLKVHLQLLTNDEQVDGFTWTPRKNSGTSGPKWMKCWTAIPTDRYFLQVLSWKSSRRERCWDDRSDGTSARP